MGNAKVCKHGCLARSCVICELERVESQIIKSEAERDEWKWRAEQAESFLRREGYVPCDIPVCNCPFWHRGHANNQLREIGDILGDLTQGKAILKVIKELVVIKEV